jgi:enamine deaminase RidA (YjgF/YER057c/UK114 family)
MNGADRERPVVTHLNPEGMHQNPAYSQGVVVEAPARTVYVGGQNAVSPEGQVVGVGDLAAQTELTLQNLATVLAAAGARLQDVVKLTVYLVQGQDFREGYGAFQRAWGDAPPPAVSAAMVSGLAHPDFLVEIDAVAILPAAAPQRGR